MLKFTHIIAHKNGIAQQVIHRDIEEALNLRGVQVHRQHAVCAGGFDHVGDELCRNGVAALGLSILPRVAEVGDHGGDTAGRGALAGVDHNEKLHEVVVHGLAGGLNEKNVAAADGFVDGHGDFAVGKGVDRAITHLQP